MLYLADLCMHEANPYIDDCVELASSPGHSEASVELQLS